MHYGEGLNIQLYRSSLLLRPFTRHGNHAWQSHNLVLIHCGGTTSCRGKSEMKANTLQVKWVAVICYTHTNN